MTIGKLLKHFLVLGHSLKVTEILWETLLPFVLTAILDPPLLTCHYTQAPFHFDGCFVGPWEFGTFSHVLQTKVNSDPCLTTLCD